MTPVQRLVAADATARAVRKAGIDAATRTYDKAVAAHRATYHVAYDTAVAAYIAGRKTIDDACIAAQEAAEAALDAANAAAYIKYTAATKATP